MLGLRMRVAAAAAEEEEEKASAPKLPIVDVDDVERDDRAACEEFFFRSFVRLFRFSISDGHESRQVLRVRTSTRVGERWRSGKAG